jgi:uncharacterized protein YjbI with pentapeptide repeats
VSGIFEVSMDDQAAVMILRGPSVWNAWREENPGALNFAYPHWYDSPGEGGIQVKGRNRLDFRGMDLSNAYIGGAFAEGLDLSGATLIDSHLEEGDFSRANFSGAFLENTRLNKTILTDAQFTGATIVNCNLNRVNLVGASFDVAEIRETVVYGIAAWDLKTTDDMKQSKLVVERTYSLYTELIAQGQLPLTVDDIELAQFVYYLTNHRKMRDAINILSDKGVLLLGRFSGGGLERLDTIREHLRKKGYLSMVFDFERPSSLSLTETVVTMAGLSKFVVVDISGPSVPAELQAIVAQLKKPVLAFGKGFGLFADVIDQTSVINVGADGPDLLMRLDHSLPDVERLHAQRIKELAERYAGQYSVT